MAISKETYDKLFGNIDWGDIHSQISVQKTAEDEYNKKVEDAKKEYESKKKEQDGGFFGKLRTSFGEDLNKAFSPVKTLTNKLPLGIPGTDLGWENPVSNSIDLTTSLTKGLFNFGVFGVEGGVKGITGGDILMRDYANDIPRKILDATAGNLSDVIVNAYSPEGTSARESHREMLESIGFKGSKERTKTEDLEKFFFGKEQSTPERIFNFGTLVATPLFGAATNLAGKATLGTLGVATSAVDSALLRLAPSMWVGAKIIGNQAIKQSSDEIASFGARLIARDLGKAASYTPLPMMKNWVGALAKEFPAGYADFKSSLPFLVGLTEVNVAPVVSEKVFGKDSLATDTTKAFRDATNFSIVKANLQGMYEQYAIMSATQKSFIKTLPKFGKELLKANLTGKGLTENVLENAPDYATTWATEGWDKMIERLKNPDDIIENFIIYGNLPNGNVSKRQILKDKFGMSDKQIDDNIKSIEDAAKTPEGRKNLSVSDTDIPSVGSVAAGGLTGVTSDGKTSREGEINLVYGNKSSQEIEDKIQSLRRERKKVERSKTKSATIDKDIRILKDLKIKKQTQEASQNAPNSSTQAPPNDLDVAIERNSIRLNKVPHGRLSDGSLTLDLSGVKDSLQPTDILNVSIPGKMLMKEGMWDGDKIIFNDKTEITLEEVLSNENSTIINESGINRDIQQGDPQNVPNSSTSPTQNQTQTNPPPPPAQQQQSQQTQAVPPPSTSGKRMKWHDELSPITDETPHTEKELENTLKRVEIKRDEMRANGTLDTKTEKHFERVTKLLKSRIRASQQGKTNRKSANDLRVWTMVFGKPPAFKTDKMRRISFLEKVRERIGFLISGLKGLDAKKGKEAQINLFRKFFTLMNLYEKDGAEDFVLSDILNDNVELDKNGNPRFKDIKTTKDLPADEVDQVFAEIFSDLFDVDGFITLLYTEPYFITKMREVYGKMIGEEKKIFKEAFEVWFASRVEKDPEAKPVIKNFYRTSEGSVLMKVKREKKNTFNENEKKVFDKIDLEMGSKFQEVEKEIEGNKDDIEKAGKAFDKFKEGFQSFFSPFEDIFGMSEKDVENARLKEESLGFAENIFSKVNNLSDDIKERIKNLALSVNLNKGKKTLSDAFFFTIISKKLVDIENALKVTFRDEFTTIRDRISSERSKRVVLGTSAPRVYISPEKQRISDKINSQEQLDRGDLAFATFDMNEMEIQDFVKGINSARTNPDIRDKVNEALLEANSKKEGSKSVNIEKALAEQGIVFFHGGEVSTLKNVVDTLKTEKTGEIVRGFLTGTNEKLRNVWDSFVSMLSTSKQDTDAFSEIFFSNSPVYKTLFSLYGKADEIKRKLTQQVQKGGLLNAAHRRILDVLASDPELIPASQIEINVMGGNNSVNLLIDDNKSLNDEIEGIRASDEAFFASQPTPQKKVNIGTLDEEISDELFQKIKRDFSKDISEMKEGAVQELKDARVEILSFKAKGTENGFDKDLNELVDKLEKSSAFHTSVEYYILLKSLKDKIAETKSVVSGITEEQIIEKIETALNTYALAIKGIEENFSNPLNGLTAEKVWKKNANKIIEALETEPSESDLKDLFGENFASIYGDIKKKWENSRKKFSIVKSEAALEKSEIEDLKKSEAEIKGEIYKVYRNNKDKAFEDGVEIESDGKLVVSPQMNEKIQRIILSTDMETFDIDPSLPLVERLTLTDAKIKAKTNKLLEKTKEAGRVVSNLGKMFVEMGNLTTRSEQTPEKLDQMKRRLDNVDVSMNDKKLTELRTKKANIKTLLRRRPEQLVKALEKNSKQVSKENRIFGGRFKFLPDNSVKFAKEGEKGKEKYNKEVEDAIKEIEEADWDSMTPEEAKVKYNEFSEKMMGMLYKGHENERGEAKQLMNEALLPIHLATKKAVEEEFGIVLENSAGQWYIPKKRFSDSLSEEGIESGKNIFYKPTATRFAKGNNIIGYSEVLPFSWGMNDYLDYWVNTYTNTFKKEIVYSSMQTIIDAIDDFSKNREVETEQNTVLGNIKNWAKRKQDIASKTLSWEGEEWYTGMKNAARNAVIYGRDIHFAATAFFYSIANIGAKLVNTGKDLNSNTLARTLRNIARYFKLMVSPSESLKRVREVGRRKSMFNRTNRLLRTRERFKKSKNIPSKAFHLTSMGLQELMRYVMGAGNTLSNEAIYIATAMALEEAERERGGKYSDGELVTFVNVNLIQTGQAENLSVVQEKGFMREMANMAMFLGGLGMNSGLIFKASGFRLVKAYREYWQKTSGTKKRIDKKTGEIRNYTKAESRADLADEFLESLISFFIVSLITGFVLELLRIAKGSPDKPLKEKVFDAATKTIGGVPYAVLSGLTGASIKYTEGEGIRINQNDSNILKIFTDVAKQGVYAATGEDTIKNLVKIAETGLYMFGVPGSAVRSMEGMVAGLTDTELPFDDRKEGKAGAIQYAAFGTTERSGSGGRRKFNSFWDMSYNDLVNRNYDIPYIESAYEQKFPKAPPLKFKSSKKKPKKLKIKSLKKFKMKFKTGKAVKVKVLKAPRVKKVRVKVLN